MHKYLNLVLIMNKLYLLFMATTTVVLLTGCNGTLEVNTELLQTKIHEPSTIKYEGLRATTVLYLDHSTCVIDARQKSDVFKGLLGQLGLYTDTLYLIKGNDFEQIPNSDKSPTSTDVYNIIYGIRDDIPFADIGQAVKNICAGNSQAILITDCEYFDKNGKNQDGFPYLTGAFKDWIKRGHTIYTVVEPYT
ncbi:hypothetical protein AGMMS49574_15820 [Bacteroidia bacterium]|nr:hypothetical protein AGMMS49574_15820 [Bacteroidia bacterium]